MGFLEHAPWRIHGAAAPVFALRPASLEPSAEPPPDHDALAIERLVATGARPGELCDTRHRLQLPSIAAARRAALELCEDGRRFELDNACDGWLLVVVQSVALEAAEVQALRAELEAAAIRVGGSYAGWEPVTPAL